MESPDKPDTAQAVGRYFQGLPSNRKASAHSGYDSWGVADYVHDHDVAYAAPGANHNGKHYELAGYSADDDWAHPEMEDMLRLCAADVASDASKYRIPLIWLDRNDLKAGRTQGITSHVEITYGYPELHGTHTDPGPHFPVGRFLELVKAAPDAQSTPSVKAGGFYSGDDIYMNLNPRVGMSSISARECKLGDRGFYTLTADGGIRAGDGAYLPSSGIFNYLGLKPEDRQGDRFFLSITPNEDGSPGFTCWSNDGGRFIFGPGKTW